MAALTTAVHVSIQAGKKLNLLPASSHWLLPVGVTW